MNSLSWLIYLADVVAGLERALSIGFFVVMLLAIATFLYGAAAGDTDFVREEDEKKKKKELRVKAWGRATKLVAIGVPAILILSTLTPNRHTVMMIAASEFGEEIATSAEAKNLGSKSYKALDKFLSDYLEEKQ